MAARLSTSGLRREARLHLLPARTGPAVAAAADRANELLVGANPSDDAADTHWFREHVDHFLLTGAQSLGASDHDRTEIAGDRRRSGELVAVRPAREEPVEVAAGVPDRRDRAGRRLDAGVRRPHGPRRSADELLVCLYPLCRCPKVRGAVSGGRRRRDSTPIPLRRRGAAPRPAGRLGVRAVLQQRAGRARGRCGTATAPAADERRSRGGVGRRYYAFIRLLQSNSRRRGRCGRSSARDGCSGGRGGPSGRVGRCCRTRPISSTRCSAAATPTRCSASNGWAASSANTGAGPRWTRSWRNMRECCSAKWRFWIG